MGLEFRSPYGDIGGVPAMWSQGIASIRAVAFAAPKGRTIETIAGDGHPGFSATQLNWVLGLTMGPDGALYFSDSGNHVIRRLDLKTRVLTVIAGNGKKGYDGDGGPAMDATLNRPYEVQFDNAGNLYFRIPRQCPSGEWTRRPRSLRQSRARGKLALPVTVARP